MVDLHSIIIVIYKSDISLSLSYALTKLTFVKLKIGKTVFEDEETFKEATSKLALISLNLNF